VTVDNTESQERTGRRIGSICVCVKRRGSGESEKTKDLLGKNEKIV